MKKMLVALILLLALPYTLKVSAEEGLLYSYDCGCPSGTGTYNREWTEWDDIDARGHVCRGIYEKYCSRCNELLGKWHMVFTDIEPHEYDGYECTVCGYWSLGTATMYDNTVYSDLRNASVGSIVTFGSYEQDGVYNNGAEPIEWIVLDCRGSQVLLLSRYGLDVQPYHHTAMAINWSNSSVRQWLQDNFYNTAFTAEEQAMIATMHNSTPVNANNAGSPGPDTYDRVFFLSSDEATRYLTSRESRMVKATSYALMRGAGTNYSQNSYWWLRSYADGSRKRVLMINSQGNVYASTIDDYQAVVRPAIWVDHSYGSAYASTSYSQPQTMSSPSTEYGSTGSGYPVGEWCQVIASSAHVRSGPGMQYPIVAYVWDYQRYEILECTMGSTGKDWYRINVDGTYGWISSGIVELD